jgi:F-type H+-transporting ATPase subunit b
MEARRLMGGALPNGGNVEALGINFGSFFFYLVNFLLLMFLLQRFLYGPVLTALANRTARIQESIENAEQVKQQLSSAQQDYEAQIARARQEAAQIMAQASERAQVQAREIVANAQSEAARIKAEAQEQAQQEREQLLPTWLLRRQAPSSAKSYAAVAMNA